MSSVLVSASYSTDLQGFWNAVTPTTETDSLGLHNFTKYGGFTYTSEGIYSPMTLQDHLKTNWSSSPIPITSEDFAISWNFKSNTTTPISHAQISFGSSSTSTNVKLKNTNAYNFKFDGVVRLTTSTLDMFDEEWHHIVLQRESGVLSFIIDGESKGNTTFYNSFSTSDYDEYFNLGSTVGRSWNGWIKNVGLWNRSLSMNEITSMTNKTYEELTAPTDTCTYEGFGDWEVNCADNCSITSSVDLGDNNIIISGTGTFTTISNITNFTDLTIAGTDSINRCEVYCLDGGCFE